MKKQDVEYFIKRLSGTSLVVSYKGTEWSCAGSRFYPTNYLIVNKAYWSKQRKAYDANETPPLILDCSVAITDTTIVVKGKAQHIEPIIKFNTRDVIIESLESLKISKTNAFPKNLEKRVTRLLQTKIDVAKRNMDTWGNALRYHELSSACEGLDD